MPYLMGGFPDIGDVARDRRGLRRRRRRPGRAGRAVLRPARRRAGHPRRRDRRAARRGDDRRRARGRARRWRARLPVVLMCYANLVLARGAERVRARLRDAGDQRADRARPAAARRPARYARRCDAAGIALVPLVAPTTTDERLAAIGAHARGFVYTVSVAGTTGERAEPARTCRALRRTASRRSTDGPGRARLRDLDARAGRRGGRGGRRRRDRRHAGSCAPPAEAGDPAAAVGAVVAQLAAGLIG